MGIINTKLKINYENNSFIYSNLNHSAKSENIYKLAKLFNSLQITKSDEYYKIVTKDISE